jgi:hypothetical protein
MAPRTANQAWSKGLDAGTHCPIVAAEIQIANLTYFRGKKSHYKNFLHNLLARRPI